MIIEILTHYNYYTLIELCESIHYRTYKHILYIFDEFILSLNIWKKQSIQNFKFNNHTL